MAGDPNRVYDMEDVAEFEYSQLLGPLRARAWKLDSPYKEKAFANIENAHRDMAHWPGLTRNILADCALAVAAHEDAARETEVDGA